MTGTWWARHVPSTTLPSTNLGPVQPFGEFSEPLVHRVFSSAHFDFGIALPITLYLLAAAAVFVTAVWELVVRVRNSGRLPVRA